MHIVRLPELLALALVISDIPFSVCAARCLGRGCLSSDDTPQRRDSTLHSRSLSHPNMIAVVAGVVAGVSVFLFAILVVILVVQSRRDKIQKVDTEGAVQLETAKPEFATLVPQAKPSTAVEHAASRLPQSVPFVSEWYPNEPAAGTNSGLPLSSATMSSSKETQAQSTLSEPRRKATHSRSLTIQLPPRTRPTFWACQTGIRPRKRAFDGHLTGLA
ncbi:unnamed protein product [Mycena citricolor]|uniref:Transmembrane protein n=1 Tax=Mycena citricolor TaxID=2018698 RepID=A0AAD2Q4Y3_9AGAR|nr:unnamed protein product [Mycena citricolor]